MSKLVGDKCQCTVCKRYFVNTHSFDRHRNGPFASRACLDLDVMRSAGFKQVAGGYWRVMG